MRRNRENKTERHECPHQVAGDHDFFAVEPVEQHAGDRPHCDGWNGARQQDAGDDQAGMGEFHGQRKDGDVIEVVANFADNLAGPGVTIIAIFAEELEKLVHQPATLPADWADGVELLTFIALSVSKAACHAARKNFD